jgi:hypothetical protein
MNQSITNLNFVSSLSRVGFSSYWVQGPRTHVYFTAARNGYILGLVVTIFVSRTFDAAQVGTNTLSNVRLIFQHLFECEFF